MWRYKKKMEENKKTGGSSFNMVSSTPFWDKIDECDDEDFDLSDFNCFCCCFDFLQPQDDNGTTKESSKKEKILSEDEKWNKLMNFCKSKKIFKSICEQCYEDKDVNKLTFRVYNKMEPPLVILSCVTGPITSHTSKTFTGYLWEDIIPYMKDEIDRTNGKKPTLYF